MNLSLDVIFKVVVMLGTGVGIGSFLFVFETRDNAELNRLQIMQRIDRIELRSDSLRNEIDQKLVRIENKIDKIVMKGK